MASNSMVKALQKELNDTLKQADAMTKKIKAINDCIIAISGSQDGIDSNIIPSTSESVFSSSSKKLDGGRERKWHVKTSLSKYIATCIYNHNEPVSLEFLIASARISRVEPELSDEKIKSRIRGALRSMLAPGIIENKKGDYKFTSFGARQYRMFRKRLDKREAKNVVSSTPVNIV